IQRQSSCFFFSLSLIITSERITMDEPKTKLDHKEDEVEDESTKSILEFLENLGVSSNIPQFTTTHDFYSELLRTLLKVDSISRGRVICSFSVLPPAANYYKGLHGGVVAAVAERVATACARTIVAEEKPLFLGEQSISYLSAAPINTQLIADASVVRSGRNLTVVSIEITLKETKKVAYTSQATFFHIPAAKL
ncbi:Acyl-coenzyme A thioesterase 13, partial [Bienertia sinuspersici]